MNVNNLAKEIQNDHIFLKLKDVVETNDHHNNESAYDHSIKTFTVAQKEINGEFILNHTAKNMFLEFTQQEINSTSRKDIMILTALLHDIGKVFSYKENGTVHSTLFKKPDGKTTCLGHDFLGSQYVFEFLNQFNVPQEIISRISNVIRLHDTFNETYLVPKAAWPIQSLISEVKSKAEGFYKEALFNIYCDNYHADFSKQQREIIQRIFNEPQLYSEREYFVK